MFLRPRMIGFTVTALFFLTGCTITSHEVEPLAAGRAFPFKELKAMTSKPGPIKFQKVVAANWKVDRSGLINLKDPKAKEAGLVDGDEEVQIYFYVIEHPQFGRFIIDSGVADVFKKNPEEAPVAWLVKKFMHLERLDIHVTTHRWLEQNPGKLTALFLTHMHLDHIMGIPDFAKDVPVYVGPGEAQTRSFQNLFVAGTTDAMFEGQSSLRELQFAPAADGNDLQTSDFFGDGSLFVLWVPGHTPGSLAFLINAEQGPQLVVGDTCHTRWGWEHHVAPGSFTSDQTMNAKSLDALEALASEIPGLKVHLGHQSATAPDKLEAAP